MNPFLRLAIGSGRLPDQMRTDLNAEGLVLAEEGLRGSVTYRRYQAPGEYASWSKEAVAGAVAITTKRLLVWAGRMRHIDVPFRHPVLATIEVIADRPDRVCFTYDAGATNPTRSGQVEVRLRTLQAGRIVQIFTAAR